MRLTDIHRLTVLRVIKRLPRRFHTTHVSQDPEVLAQHAHLRGERNYNAVFGSFLSRLAHETDAPIRYLSPGNGDALWERTGAEDGTGMERTIGGSARLETRSASGGLVSVMTKVNQDVYEKLRLIAFVRRQRIGSLFRMALENMVKDVNIPEDLMRQISEAAGEAEPEPDMEDEE